MTIYSSKRNHREYRKIYENHYGPIPVDETGRSFDIHHIDGDSSNNHPTNLMALSVAQHYQIHLDQGDYFAAWKIAISLEKSPSEISELSKLHARKRVDAGIHNFQTRPDGSSVASDLVKNGTHHLLGGDIQRRANRDRIENGTHNCLLRGEKAPRFDKRIFHLIHEDGEEFKGTQYDFRKAYPDVRPGHFSRLISGNLKSTKGWRLQLL